MPHLPVESISRSAWRVAFILLAAGAAFAHDIPVDATVQAFVKPAGNRLHFVVRVPLQTMRDVDVPVDARGFLDLDALRPQLPDAATLWIGNFVWFFVVVCLFLLS